MTPLLRSLLLWTCALTAACANQIRSVDTASEREQPAVLETRYVVEPSQGTVARTRLRLVFARQETTEVRVEKSVTRTEERTPYRAVVELYEVPAGLVSVPLSLALNAVDLVLLGSLPNEPVIGFTGWSFAALNPFLNAENPARIETRQVNGGSSEAQRSQQSARSPLAQTLIELRLDERPPARLFTDADGALVVDLLSLLALSSDMDAPRKLSVAVLLSGLDAPAFSQAYVVDSALGQRLASAGPLGRVAADPQASPDALAQAIFALDRLGLSDESAELQASARQRLAAAPRELAVLVRGLATLDASMPSATALIQSLSRGAGAPPAAMAIAP